MSSFTSASNVSVCLKWDIPVKYVCIADAHSHVAKNYTKKLPSTRDLCLITTPLCDPEVLKSWKGKIYIHLPTQPTIPFFEDIMPFMYCERIEDTTGKYRKFKPLFEHQNLKPGLS